MNHKRESKQPNIKVGKEYQQIIHRNKDSNFKNVMKNLVNYLSRNLNENNNEICFNSDG